MNLLVKTIAGIFTFRARVLLPLFGVIAGTLCTVQAHAQADIHFSQFYETSVLRNPALTGVFADDYKVGVYVRNQWSSISNPYATGLISAESHVSTSRTSDDFFSFGLLAYQDKAGSVDQKITTIYPAINYNLSVDPAHNSYFSVGFTGGYVQYSYDPTKATFNNQYQNGKFSATNPTLETLPTPKIGMWDLGAGINYNTSSGYDNKSTFVIGASGYHFTKPKMSYYDTVNLTQNMRLNGNIAFNYTVSDEVTIMMQGNYGRQGKYQEILVGGLMNFNKEMKGMNTSLVITGGVFYRVGDAVIPVLKGKYNNMALAVSYDLNISTLNQASNFQGGYEITLFITGNYTNKGPEKKTVCPKF